MLAQTRLDSEQEDMVATALASAQVLLRIIGDILIRGNAGTSPSSGTRAVKSRAGA